MYGMPGPQYNPPSGMSDTSANAKGKGRIVELDNNAWEAQFAKLETDRAVTSEKATQSNSLQTPASFQDIEGMQEDQEAIQEAENETDHEFMENLERTWKNLKDTMDTSALSDRELAAWEAQYGSDFADLHGGDWDNDTAYSSTRFDPAALDAYLQNLAPFPYTKESENPYVKHFDPYAEGQRLLTSGQPLSEAALAFEAACRQNEHRGEAWRALGDTLAADEKELRAIKALERAVSCPDGGGEGAWMSLAISYVNEGQDMRAFATLEKWITSAYPDITSKIQTDSSQDNPWSISNRIVEMFLAAARAGPAARLSGDKGEPVDADVQSGLGVLFYTNSDYQRARDCFEAALSVRSDVRSPVCCSELSILTLIFPGLPALEPPGGDTSQWRPARRSY